jgi:hypothetical protein
VVRGAQKGTLGYNWATLLLKEFRKLRQLNIALRWVWSFREAMAGSLSDARVAVSSAKFAVVVAGEVESFAVYMR